MEKYPFIFSNQPYYRWRRHFVFWFCWWVFSGFLYSFSAGILGISYFSRLPVSLLEALFYLIPHMFASYSLLYFVIPKLLLKGRYRATVITVLLLFLLTAVISTTIGMFVIGALRQTIFGEKTYPLHIAEINFFLGLLAGLRGGITVGGLAAAIKLSKYWFIKEQRNRKTAEITNA